MGKIPYGYVPDFETEKDKFKHFLNLLYSEVFGAGGGSGNLDSDNGTLSEEEAAEVSRDTTADMIQNGEAITWTRDGDTLTGEVTKGSAVTDAVASSVSVDSADATDLPTVITLANENKADTNTLVTDVNAIKTVVNNIKSSLETAKLMET
jgi:hypothetical protein